MSDELAEVDRATSAEDILAALRSEAGANGFQHQLDPLHSVSFLARGPSLLVTFERTDDTLSLSETGLPIGLDFVEDKNWSLLHFTATSDSWFRSSAVYEFLDEMVDDAFFEDFDRVTFYGSGMGGYAAAAFSVVSPGATIIAISPQATLDVERTEWDDRFPAARRLVFDDRYGYAPDMIEGTGAAYILYDPHARLDAMHASLFRGPNVTRLKCRFLQDHIAWSLNEMGLLHRIIEAAAGGALPPHEFYRLLRARRNHARYLRNMLFHMDDLDDPYLMGLYCAHVLSRMSAPAFRRRLDLAKEALERDGALPDWLASQPETGQSAESAD
ncbi:MAG: phosphoadenosine phosphosulfate reductase [Rhodobacter sp.]|nr:phosphoadenosine phosphosulfate reductase [Rhodobacter sp.]